MRFYYLSLPPALDYVICYADVASLYVEDTRLINQTVRL